MSDVDLRLLERAAATGGEADRLRYVHALLRDGRLDRTRFEVLAQLRDPFALQVLDLSKPADVPEFGRKTGCQNWADEDGATPVAHDVRRIRTISREAALRACLAACRPIAKRPDNHQHNSDSVPILRFVEQRLTDPVETWTSSFLWSNDRARWKILCSLNSLGCTIDAWAMLLYGFEDPIDWSGARCILHAAVERESETLVRVDVVRELRAWALTEIKR